MFRSACIKPHVFKGVGGIFRLFLVCLPARLSPGETGRLLRVGVGCAGAIAFTS